MFRKMLLSLLVMLGSNVLIAQENSSEYYEDGVADFENENYESAIEKFSNAITLDTSMELAYLKRAEARLNLSEKSNANKDHDSTSEDLFNAVITDCNKAISLNAHNAIAYALRGHAKIHHKEYAGAMDDYRVSIDIDPERAESYLNLGYAEYNLQQTKAAIKHYSKYIKLKCPSKNSSDCHDLRFDTNFTKAFLYRADAYSDIENYKEALGDYNFYLHSNDADPNVMLSRGFVNMHLYNYAAAEEDFNVAIDLDSNLYMAKFFNGVINYEKYHSYEEIVQIMSKVINKNVSYAGAYYYRALANSKLQNYKEAIADFSTTIQLDPQNAEAYFERGKIRLLLKEAELACEDFVQSQKMKPNYFVKKAIKKNCE